jgi:alkaline phosphatase D
VGDVSGDGAIVWSCSDRRRMIVEADARVPADAAAAGASRTRIRASARVELAVCPGARRSRTACRLGPSDPKGLSLPGEGRFHSAPIGAGLSRSVRLAWSADVVGQGFGIDVARGGLRGFGAIRQLAPDLFVHCGDTIYADNPLVPELTLDDGTLWRNLVTPAKSNGRDARRVPRQLSTTWKTEPAALQRRSRSGDLGRPRVRNNWFRQSQDAPRRRSVAVLAAPGAFLEHQPIRYAGTTWAASTGVAYGPLLDVFAIDMRSERGRTRSTPAERRVPRRRSGASGPSG